MIFPTESRGEIEPKPVNMHFRDPVAQAIHNQLQDVCVAGVRRVSAPRIVHVEAALAWD